MVIIHSFALAAIIYFVLARKGNYEKLVFLCLPLCFLHFCVAYLAPNFLVPDAEASPVVTEAGSPTGAPVTRSWMDPISPETEARRGTVVIVAEFVFCVALFTFVLLWFKMDPLRAAAIVFIYMLYVFSFSFLSTQIVELITARQERK